MNWNTVFDNNINNDNDKKILLFKMYINYGIKQIMKMIITTMTIDFINNEIDNKLFRIN